MDRYWRKCTRSNFASSVARMAVAGLSFKAKKKPQHVAGASSVAIGKGLGRMSKSTKNVVALQANSFAEDSAAEARGIIALEPGRREKPATVGMLSKEHPPCRSNGLPAA